MPAPLGHRNEIGTLRSQRPLRAGDLVEAVVPDDDREILRCRGGGGSERPQLHQNGAVAIEREHLAVRLATATPSAMGVAIPMLPSM